jgi:hypothetical protein
MAIFLRVPICERFSRLAEKVAFKPLEEHVKVPEVTNRMRELADKLKLNRPKEANELLELADELKRRPPGPRAPTASTSMTPELAQDIRDYVKAHPGASQQSVAEAFNVNHGRVSEAIRGKRA